MKPVFLVDDSPTILASLSAILARAGVPVQKAATGEEALAAFKAGQKPPRMIVTDYHMPGMNGVELVREARKIPALRFVPILLLTTESEQARRDEARKAGATGWLVKPVDAGKFLAVLDQVAPV